MWQPSPATDTHPLMPACAHQRPLPPRLNSILCGGRGPGGQVSGAIGCSARGSVELPSPAAQVQRCNAWGEVSAQLRGACPALPCRVYDLRRVPPSGDPVAEPVRCRLPDPLRSVAGCLHPPGPVTGPTCLSGWDDFESLFAAAPPTGQQQQPDTNLFGCLRAEARCCTPPPHAAVPCSCDA
jgi:hypothetical protein